MVERVNTRVLGDVKNRITFGVNAPLKFRFIAAGESHAPNPLLAPHFSEKEWVLKHIQAAHEFCHFRGMTTVSKLADKVAAVWASGQRNIRHVSHVDWVEEALKRV